MILALVTIINDNRPSLHFLLHVFFDFLGFEGGGGGLGVRGLRFHPLIRFVSEKICECSLMRTAQMYRRSQGKKPDPARFTLQMADEKFYL